MTHTDPLEPIRLALARNARRAFDAATPSCLDDDTVAALAEGTLDASARAAAMPHLAACARCRSAVGSVARALADSSVAREIATVEGGLRRRFYQIAALALPVAAVLALLLARPWAPEEPVHRAPTITASAAPTAISPVGAVADAGTLRWNGVLGADRYRVTLFGAEGRVIYDTELVGIQVDLPDSVVLAPGVPYLWKVEARTGFDRWSASDLIEFSIARDPRP